MSDYTFICFRFDRNNKFNVMSVQLRASTEQTPTGFDAFCPDHDLVASGRSPEQALLELAWLVVSTFVVRYELGEWTLVHNSYEPLESKLLGYLPGPHPPFQAKFAGLSSLSREVTYKFNWPYSNNDTDKHPTAVEVVLQVASPDELPNSDPDRFKSGGRGPARDPLRH